MAIYPATNPSQWAPKPATPEQRDRLEVLLNSVLDGTVVLPAPTLGLVRGVLRGRGDTVIDVFWRQVQQAVRKDGHSDFARDLAALVSEARNGV